MEQNQDVKKHYWMGSAVISFVHEDMPMDTSLNVLLTNKDQFVTKKMLERAQVQAQIQLSKNLGDKLPDVKHVYMQSMSYLGHMTEKEFFGEPETLQ